MLAGKVDAPNAPIPHWREYDTTSRRTSLVIDPPERPISAARPRRRPLPVAAMRQPAARRAVRLLRGLRARRALHRPRRRLSGRDVPGGLQRQHANPAGPGFVAITYELIHDTRVIPIDSVAAARTALSPAIRTYMGDARGHWEGTTLVVETDQPEGEHARRFTGFASGRALHAHGTGLDPYQVTFVDPATWTAPGPRRSI